MSMAALFVKTPYSCWVLVKVTLVELGLTGIT